MSHTPAADDTILYVTGSHPRMRQLDVTDAHVVELLTGITSVILSRRRAGMEAGLAALEMQAALNTLVSGS